MSARHRLVWTVGAMLCLVCLAATGTTAMARTPTEAATGSALLFSPYKYVPRFLDATTHAMQTAVTGATTPLLGKEGVLPSHLPALRAITLAFATGECGSETWHGVPATAVIDVAIPALQRAGVDYVISTGGEGARFTCATPEAFERFIRRYWSPRMLGVDFDIENNQTLGEIRALVADAARAQHVFPNLRFSFTLATWAGSDGKHAGLNPLGDSVLQAIKASRLSHYTIDLMVMDYGKTDPAVCVVVHGACDMGASAIQAAGNLQYRWGTPASKIELTPIIGVNDNADEIFSLEDMDTMVQYAVDHGLAGIHFWSLDRDTPCPDRPGKANQEPICNGTGDPPLAFTRRALHDLGR